MNFALLLSGGTGTRLQSDIPKQYIRVAGKLLITYSLKILINSPYIDAIEIVAEPEWEEHIIADLGKSRLSMEKLAGWARPGFNRQASIVNGLKEILCEKETDVEDTVLIHDAARPMLTERQLMECYSALPSHDGVMPALPMKDTVYLSQDGSHVSKLLDRDRIFAGQAPELFYLDKYYQANMNLGAEGLAKINGSTEPAILAGMDIAVIPGDENNFKITTKADLERFRELKGAGKG